MQLTPPRPAGTLRQTLSAATAALLSPMALPVAAQTPPPQPRTATPPESSKPEWQFDGAVLVYRENDGRVTAVEPVINGRRSDGNERAWGLKLTLDSLTGASPNGAVAQPAPQTFTSPSGRSTYTAGAGRVPLDPSFKDTRVALAGSHERPFGDGQRLSLGANLSSEYDFASFGLNAALARDFNQKNTTLSLGLGFEADRIRPVGGVPAGLKPVGAARTGGNESRTVTDLLLGVTQVVNRRWVSQLNLGWGVGSGYHTDAYKLLSVVDGSTGLLAGDRYVAEQRPTRRARTSVYWQNKVHLGEDVIDGSLRAYRDDWGVRAWTADLRWRTELRGGWYLEPRVRLHRQTAADFWRPWLVEGREWDSTTGRSTLTAASADPRLGAFDGRTLGLKLGLPLAQGEFVARVEAYTQTPDRIDAAPGALAAMPLTPTLKSTMVLLGWSRRF